jgi:hypothetical protein
VRDKFGQDDPNGLIPRLSKSLWMARTAEHYEKEDLLTKLDVLLAQNRDITDPPKQLLLCP